jgi:cobalt-zinc-cadmium efflux system membrane fusion protein
MKSKNKIQFLFLTFILLFTFACKDDKEIHKAPLKPVVSDEGKKITFPIESKGLDIIKTDGVKVGTGFISVLAPARVIASITNSLKNEGKIVLFENPEMTSLYSDYNHSKNSYKRATQNLKRVRDMFKNLVATQKDVIDAEADEGNARADLNENEGKLRAIGFNPVELENIRTNVVWIICDVPESDLHTVKKGQKVDVFFNSFPEEKFYGKADAIGDNIDPVTRTIKVRVSMPNEKSRFMPGMFAKVAFGDQRDSTIILPADSVVTVESRDYVFVKVANGVFVRREVVVGNSNLQQVVISRGLNHEEEVVTSGAILLKGLSFGY